MNLKDKLSQPIGMGDINDILCLVCDNDSQKQELYDLVLAEDQRIGYYATWVFTHFSEQQNRWLYCKQDELIDELLRCKHAGKRRLILSLLYKQPLANPPRVDFLDFCLLRMVSVEELPGAQSLCIKIAYELCRPIKELTQELKTILEMMQGNPTPAIQAARKNVLKAMQKGKSLQKY